MLIRSGSEVFGRRDTANNDKLVDGVVDEAVHFFGALGATSIDWPDVVRALSSHLSRRHSHEKRKGQCELLVL